MWRAEAGDRRRCSYGGRASTDGAPEPDERRRRQFPRACERRRSRGLVAVACRGGRPVATHLWRTGKHRRRFRTERAATVVVSSGVRAAAIQETSSCGMSRRATSGDAPMAGVQAPTVLPNRTSGGGAP
jgi:hypothetical protein